MAYDFPANPAPGTVVGDYTWNGSAWVGTSTTPGGLPCGSIIPWAGTTAPANWLLCDGAAISRTTYSSLFGLIGTTYGAGNGSTTFNVPDLRGRVPVGKGSETFGVLGSTGGSETVTLTTAQMPSHTHVQDAHSHGGVIITGGLSVPNGSYYGVWGNYGLKNTDNATATNQYTGGGQAHNNIQPYQVVNYIIKTTIAATAGDSEFAPRVTTAESKITTAETKIAALESELNKVSFAQINKTTLQAFGSGFMTIQFNEILFAKNIQLVGNLVRFTHPGVYKISVGMRIANDAGDSWTGMSLYNATAGRVGISYGTGNVAGDPGPMEFTFLANITNTSVDYAVQLYRAGSVLTQLTPDVNAGKAIAATFERIGSL